MSFVNILGVVLAAVGVTGMVSLIRRAGEIGRLGREELEDLDDVPVIDGWYALAGDLPIMLASQATPGERMQYATRSASSSRDRYLWVLTLGCIALGVIQMSYLPVCVGTLGFVLLVRGRTRDLRFRQRAVITTACAKSVLGPTYCATGVAHVDVEGCAGTLAVTVPWRLCQSLVDRHGAVCLLVAFDPDQPTRQAYAIGVRAPTATLAVVEADADSVLVPVRRARRDTE